MSANEMVPTNEPEGEDGNGGELARRGEEIVKLPPLLTDCEYEQAVVFSINHEWTLAVAAAESGIEHARRCGAILIEVKNQLGHGRFLPWLAANVKFSERKAQYLMKLHANWDELKSKTQDAADFGITEAIRMLTKEKEMPHRGRDDILPLFLPEQVPYPQLPPSPRISGLPLIRNETADFIQALLDLSRRAEQIDAEMFAAMVRIDQVEGVINAGGEIIRLIAAVQHNARARLSADEEADGPNGEEELEPA